MSRRPIRAAASWRRRQMKTIREVLRQKGETVHTIGPDATVFEALQRMAELKIGALVVVEGGRPVGLLSERDYARSVVLKGRTSRDTPVREIMVRRVIGVRPDQPLEECMALMTERRVRHLPVVEDGQLVGLISIGDAIKAIISEQKFIIEQLEHYISS
jgi:CBS domain-containing protein